MSENDSDSAFLQDEEMEAHQLSSHFISPYKQSDSSGLVHLNLPEGQRSALVHFFRPDEFSEKLLSEISPEVSAKLKTGSRHLVVVIVRVSLPRSWKNW